MPYTYMLMYMYMCTCMHVHVHVYMYIVCTPHTTELVLRCTQAKVTINAAVMQDYHN